MRYWDRRGARVCGQCGASIAHGDPRLVIVTTIGGVDKEWLRCPRCAGEPMPADLPAINLPVAQPIVPVPKASTLTRRPLLALVQDWKTRAIGREPGSDDE